MIYHLFQYLERAGVDIPGMGLMHYLSFRAMMATVAAVLFTLLVGKRIIRILQRHQIGDVPRDLGLDGAELKKGVPTMGGIIIILGLLTGVLLFCDLTRRTRRLSARPASATPRSTTDSRRRRNSWARWRSVSSWA